MSAAELAPLLSLLKDMSARLGRVEAAVGAGGGGGGGGGGAAPAAAAPAASSRGGILGKWDAFLAQYVVPIMGAAEALGAKDAKALATFILDCFTAHGAVLAASEECKMPTTAEEAQQLLKAQKAVSDECKTYREKNRKMFNHVKAANEMLGTLSSYVFSDGVNQKCLGTVISGLGAMDTYGNRARVDFKKSKKGDLHMAYLNACTECMKGLKTFVLMNGLKDKLKWNAKGPSVLDYTFTNEGEAAAGSAAEPPPAKKEEEPEEEKKEAPKPKRRPMPAMPAGGLFAEIGKLKSAKDRKKIMKNKVTDDMKTYKNTKLRGDKKFVKKKPRKNKKAEKKTKPPKFEFNRFVNTWYVEWQPDGTTMDVVIEDPKHSVYVDKCGDCTINIKGTVKMVSVGNCERTKVIFENALTKCEINRSKRVHITVTDVCKMFTIDGTDGCKVNVSEKSQGAMFSTSKSSEMNVEWSLGDPTDPKTEWVMEPIPEQYEHKITKENKIHTQVSSLYGH